VLARVRPVSRVAAALLLGAATALPLGAQGTSGVTITGISTGARIRVAARDVQPFVGTLIRRMGDTLVVELPSGAALTIPEGRLTRLDVSGGVRRRTWQGAGIGLIAGAGIGTAVALASYRRTDCIDSAIAQGLVCPFIDDVSRQTTVFVDAALIGTAGTILGALIGHAGRETWIPVSLTEARRVGMVLGVGRGGGRVGIALTP